MSMRHLPFLPQVLPQAFVEKVVGTLQIFGKINLGKTGWACAQFSNPVYVTSRDGLRAFIPSWYDGIVVDKMEFQDWKVTDCESLTDCSGQSLQRSIAAMDARRSRRTRQKPS